jgi:Putative transposase
LVSTTCDDLDSRTRLCEGGGDSLLRTALDSLELIRRWLLHVLPKGLTRVRHYSWLSPAAQKTPPRNLRLALTDFTALATAVKKGRSRPVYQNYLLLF